MVIKMENESGRQPYEDSDIQGFVGDITKILEDKKAMDIDVMHVKKLTVIADYFVICTGTSNTHIRTLCGEVEQLMETKHGLRPLHIEGYESATWILVDYGPVVVHIFHREARQFYSLERLWADAPKYTEKPGKALDEASKTDGEKDK